MNNTSTRLGIHFPWLHGTVYIGHAGVANGKYSKDYSSNLNTLTNKKVLVTYRRDGGTADVWLNAMKKHEMHSK